MNFQALLSTDELLNQNLYCLKGDFVGIDIVPWQSGTPFMFGDNWPIIPQGHCFPIECYTKFL